MFEFKGPYSINAELEVPGDKSISHRALIISSIAKGKSKIKNFLFSEDCLNTLSILKKLGVNIETDNKKYVFIDSQGIDNFKEPDDVLYVGNSGTSIRLLAGLLCSCSFMSVLSGDNSINNRPMERIIIPLNAMGADVRGRLSNTKPPLVILKANKLNGINHKISISSAQVKSCILFAGLNSSGPTEINQPEVSRDHTERMMEYFGAEIEYNGKDTKLYPLKKPFEGKDIYVPGDFSSAAYFLIAAIILKNSKVKINNVGINPTRSYMIELLIKMGADIKLENIKIVNNEPVADIIASSSKLKPVEINEKFIPNIIDEIPVLSAALAFADGVSIIKGAGELRFKESDRINTMATQLKKTGIDIREHSDGFEIHGIPNNRLSSGSFDSCNDHRIAMSLSILSLAMKGKTIINNTECVNTSFPDFEKLLYGAIKKT